jgi:hypothetical protein
MATFSHGWMPLGCLSIFKTLWSQVVMEEFSQEPSMFNSQSHNIEMEIPLD